MQFFIYSGHTGELFAIFYWNAPLPNSCTKVYYIQQYRNQSIRVNALLDDAKTNTLINLDVTTDLALQAKMERAKVHVLNGQTEHSKLAQLT